MFAYETHCPERNKEVLDNFRVNSESKLFNGQKKIGPLVSALSCQNDKN